MYISILEKNESLDRARVKSYAWESICKEDKRMIHVVEPATTVYQPIVDAFYEANFDT